MNLSIHNRARLSLPMSADGTYTCGIEKKTHRRGKRFSRQVNSLGWNQTVCRPEKRWYCSSSVWGLSPTLASYRLSPIIISGLGFNQFKDDSPQGEHPHWMGWGVKLEVAGGRDSIRLYSKLEILFSKILLSRRYLTVHKCAGISTWIYLRM